MNGVISSQYIKEYTNYLFDIKKVTFKTFENRINYLFEIHQYLLAEYGYKYKVEEIFNQENIIKYQKTIIESKKSYQIRFDVLKSFIDMLLWNGHINTSVKFINLRRKRSETIKYLTPLQWAELYEYIKSEKNEFKRIRNMVMFNLLQKTGVRASEAIQLQLNDVINLDEIKVIRKGQKIDSIFVPNSIKKLSEEFKEIRDSMNIDSKALIINQKGNPFSSITLLQHVKYIGEKFGINLYPHMLRHTFASILANSGESLVHIRDLLGQVDIRNTSTYMGSFPEEKKAAYFRNFS